MNKTENSTWIIPEVTVECYKLKPIAVYCVILFIIGLLSNSTLIYVLLRHRSLLNPVNLLLLALGILSLIGVLIELPLVTISAILCK